jgi:hypothetical protein
MHSRRRQTLPEEEIHVLVGQRLADALVESVSYNCYIVLVLLSFG